MGTDRKANLRARRRAAGMKPIEVWLPSDLLDKIDEMKAGDEFNSREAVIMALVAGTLDDERPARSKDQLGLL